ncbi:hypothetical protein BDV93DRAFT_506795 [Ceratobasidium sp. AG-I]|nr:hypothetical protein BDV93DRAFT_506795 [Ceratobasidium sp. AG-I]
MADYDQAYYSFYSSHANANVHPQHAYPAYTGEDPSRYLSEYGTATISPLFIAEPFMSSSLTPATVHPSALQVTRGFDDSQLSDHSLYDINNLSDMSDPQEWLQDISDLYGAQVNMTNSSTAPSSTSNPAPSILLEASNPVDLASTRAPHLNQSTEHVLPQPVSYLAPTQTSPTQPPPIHVTSPSVQRGLKASPPQPARRLDHTGRSPTPSIRVTRRPSPLDPPRRVKGQALKATEAQSSRAGVKKNACVACKGVKTKCEWKKPDDESCVKCTAAGKLTLTSLKNLVLAKEEQIHQMIELLEGGRSDRQLVGTGCDCPPATNSNSAGAQAHKAGCHVLDPIELYNRARLMDLQDPDGSESESEEDSSEDDRRRSPGISMNLPLPHVPSGTPVGMFFELSLSLNSPTSEHPGRRSGSPDEPADVGLAGADYFMPGPATRPEIRRIMIERQRMPQYLVKGTIRPDECLKLFDEFMRHWNVSVSVLDPDLHTAKSVLARCPFLFTVVLAIAARGHPKPELYQILMQEAKAFCGMAIVEFWKSVEIVQAFILLAVFPPPARRWDEDKSWMYLGCAIRLASDLDLNRTLEGPFANEMAEREYLNRTRTWLICHNLEVSAAAKLGKVTTIQEDSLIASSKTWWKSSKYCTKFDIHLCAFTQILLIFHKYYRMLVSNPSAPGDYNAHMDIGLLAERFSDEIESFQTHFERIFAEESDPNDAACRYRAHVRYSAHYFQLVIYSICHRKLSARSAQDSNPMLLRCLDAASKLVKAFADHHAHSEYFKYSAEGWFTFGAFAAAFMIKLLGPTFAGTISNEQRAHLRSLVIQLTTAYASPAVSIDSNHTPNIYARFLSRLLNRADELNGDAPGGVGEHPREPKLEMDDLWGFPAVQILS